MPERLASAADVTQRNRHLDDVVERGSSISLPELCGRVAPDALYRIDDRCGVSVAAVSEQALDERQLDALSRFRFAQFLACGFIDKDVAFRERMERDALAPYTSAESMHFIAFAAATGQLLASMCLYGPPPAEPGALVRDHDRPLLPVEEQFGCGAFNRLAIMPDTPIDRVREFGRLVKNVRGPVGIGSRAVVELFMVATRLLLGPLSTAVEVCIGGFETTRAWRVLEFFHTPMVAIKGGLPVFPPGHPLNAPLVGRTRHMFAFRVADLPSMAPRLDAIAAALALPGADGVSALAALKRIPYDAPSTLVPSGGIPALCNTPLPQRSMSLAERRRARERGDRLRRFPVLAGLSATEATTLRTFAVESRVKPGVTILRRGGVADELLFIDEGLADKRIPGRPASALGPTDCLGTAGVLAGGASAADVIARTPMRLLHVPGDVYRTYLRDLPDVERKLQRLSVADHARWAPTTRLLAAATADIQAALRAAGAVERDPALRNPDHMAGAFLKPQLRVQTLAKIPGARRLVPALAERLAPGSYYYETARVKHLDAVLRLELEAGLDQLVILGAGHDSQPYRFADELRNLRVYEVDLPSMSARKRRSAARAMGRAPVHVTYIAADLLADDLIERLEEHSFDLRAATLLMLPGVAMYLPEPAVARLLSLAGRHTCPRSSIVFDYLLREMVEGDDSFYGAAQVRRRVTDLGEPLRFGIPTGGAARFIAPFGLELTSDLQPADLADRYLRRTNGSLGGRPYGFAAIAHARVTSYPDPDPT